MGEREAVDVEQVIHRDMQLTAFLRVAEAVEHFPAFAAADYKSRAFQLSEMMRHGGAGHIYHISQPAHALLAVAEYPEDAQPRGVAELRERLADLFAKLGRRHMRHYPFVVVAVSVIVHRQLPFTQPSL